MTKKTIVIVDDHPLFRGALSQSIGSGTHTGLGEVDILEAGSLADLTEVIRDAGDIDLVLLDLTMPGVRGLSGLMLLRAQHPDIPVIVVSAREDAQTVRRCIEIGASAYVPKSLPVDDIRNAVRSVFNGDVWVPEDYDLAADGDGSTDDIVAQVSKLTPQQLRVLVMLGEGLLNKQIAYELGVSEATVKAHVSAILQKLGVDSRTQAVIAINSVDRSEWLPPAS
ncbi:MAG: response regulator [Hyphomicrobiaceae bacterium]